MLDDEDVKWYRSRWGGEQQRLAFARLFLHKPDSVVMDEATSALDPESQAMLMEKLGELLPETAIISVGHRPELEAFHERKVNPVRRKGGPKLISHEMVARPVNILSNFMKRWRAPSTASPATPTAQSSSEKEPKVAAGPRSHGPRRRRDEGLMEQADANKSPIAHVLLSIQALRASVCR